MGSTFPIHETNIMDPYGVLRTCLRSVCSDVLRRKRLRLSMIDVRLGTVDRRLRDWDLAEPLTRDHCSLTIPK